MASSSPSEDAIVGINVTPLVDITLVLLIVFMVGAKLIAAQAMPLDLPKAAHAGEAQTVLTVAVDPMGKVTANGRVLADDDELARVAKTEIAREPELRTVIDASTGVPYGAVLHVLDVLRGAGVQKVAFGVDPMGAKP